MPEVQVFHPAQTWLAALLLWTGMAVIAGLAARTILPIRRPIGTSGTLFLGAAGSTLGICVLTFFSHDQAVNPIGPMGISAAVCGALVLLILSEGIRALWFRHHSRGDTVA